MCFNFIGFAECVDVLFCFVLMCIVVFVVVFVVMWCVLCCWCEYCVWCFLSGRGVCLCLFIPSYCVRMFVLVLVSVVSSGVCYCFVFVLLWSLCVCYEVSHSCLLVASFV